MNIQNFTYLPEHTISISFDDFWHDEDIPNLAQTVFARIENHQLVETVLGADRQYLRFIWQTHHYILHFEFYAQSSWIESEPVDESAMKLIYEQLS